MPALGRLHCLARTEAERIGEARATRYCSGRGETLARWWFRSTWQCQLARLDGKTMIWRAPVCRRCRFWRETPAVRSSPSWRRGNRRRRRKMPRGKRECKGKEPWAPRQKAGQTVWADSTGYISRGNSAAAPIHIIGGWGAVADHNGGSWSQSHESDKCVPQQIWLEAAALAAGFKGNMVKTSEEQPDVEW